MDRRIPPEPPVQYTPVRNNAVELRVKQGLHKEAFDTALQQADQRRTMDSRDRTTAASVKQSQQAQFAQEQTNPFAQSGDAAEHTDLLTKQKRSEQFDGEQAAMGRELLRNELHHKHHSAKSADTQSLAGTNRTLNHESLALLLKKIHASHCAVGEHIELELIDDPNGVMAINLVRDQDNGWAIKLLLDTDASLSGAEQRELSQSLAGQLEQNNIRVSSVSIDIEQAALSAQTNQDGQ